MTTTKTLSAVALIGAATALALPAGAAAHPAVYAQTARVNTAPAGATPVYADQERYVVANHGFTYVLRESNGRGPGAGQLARGVITYAKAEGKGRTAGFVDSVAARTGVQAHATCEIPAGPTSLGDEATIRSWQGATAEDAGEPFYAYVPFQTGSAGLEDDPARWLPVVLAKTGVDLRTVADTDAARKAACEAPAVGGTYYPADATQSSVASFNSGLIEETEARTAAPFEARIRTFEETLAAATAKQAATDAQLAAAVARPAQGAAAKPLAATLATRRLTPARLVSSGVPVSVTGPAGQAVRVRATVTAAAARKHRLRSTVLGSKAGRVGTDGTATVVVKPSAAQGRKLRSARGSVAVTLELVVGTTKATVTR
jgi:hypothetical protein